MDQLDILQGAQDKLGAYEQTLLQLYARLERRTLAVVSKHYEKYGETLSESSKYNRLNELKKQLDQAAAEVYSEVAAQTQASTEESFNYTYLAYAYLAYAVLSEDEGEFQPITETAVKTSVAVAVAYLLLRSRKRIYKEFVKLSEDVLDIFTKHKLDYVYNVHSDVRNNLKVEAGYKAVVEQVKKRAATAKVYGVNRLRDAWNAVVNFAQEQVYQATKKPLKSNKMWLSMRDDAVRVQHRTLDSQLADVEGWFHYAGDKAKYPKQWKAPNMNWGCRCKVILLFNGKLPQTSQIHNYQDVSYNEKLNARIAELRKNKKTYLQALQQAKKEIRAPKRKIKGYITFGDWLEKYGPQEDEE